MSANILMPAEPENDSAEIEQESWPAPMPLVAKLEPQPYPIDALPATVKAAVDEVLAFVKSPVPLVASSALSAMSLAMQACFDVKRAEKLTGPVGLFLLTIADSGERKSTCDGYFTRAISEYQERQRVDAEPFIKDYEAKKESWKARHSGIKEKIRQCAKTGKPTDKHEVALRELEDEKPVPPKVPHLIYGDTTPEALKYELAKRWPSAGIVSSEAGAVFGAHGMSQDSIMRNLATLNQLWDGATISTDRRTSESFTVRGARLTMALQVQEPTLRSFFDRSGGLARGTGFLARFLVAWPESTQGSRAFTEPPTSWPALGKFNRRITELLMNDAPIDATGALTPAVLPLTVEAKRAWIAFHDNIESELRSGGELYDVRDVASKTADNAVRIAALFQLFEDGGSGAIGAVAFDGASRIAFWHLHEALRFYGELALHPDQANAVRLNDWLLDYCRQEKTAIIPRREVQRRVIPAALRKGAALDAALDNLIDLDRMSLSIDGKRKEIHVNPALLPSCWATADQANNLVRG